MAGAYVAAFISCLTLIGGISGQYGSYRGEGGFGGQYAPTTTPSPLTTWDQYVWKVKNSWEETNEESGQTLTGFQAVVTIPVPEKINGQWEIQLLFTKPVGHLQAWNVLIADWSQNYTDYLIKNREHNGFLEKDSLLTFDLMAHTHGEPPNAIVDWPSVGLSFANPDDSGLGGGGQESHDMRDVLGRSMDFFVAQRSGKLPADQASVDWRGDSALGDGGDAQLDLVGGYYIGGDHVKWGFPMAFATTVVAWSGISYNEAYGEMGHDGYGELFKQVKWATDYFMKAHSAKYELFVQIGEPVLDHEEWVRSEYMEMPRPSFAVDEDNPGSDVAAETAAALAAAAILFLDQDTTYAEQCLGHAIDLLEMAILYRGKYDDSVESAKTFYRSTSYGDEIAWAALWLYWATDDDQYLTVADDFISEFNLDDVNSSPTEFSYDDKTVGVNFLHALLTGNANDPGVTIVTNFCDNFLAEYQSNGYLRMSDWHNFGSVSGVAYICLFAADKIVTGATEQDYVQFSKDLINDILGAGERSYMVGYGFNPPKRIHHRDSACPIDQDCGWGVFNDKYTPNHFTLTGAIVGGPGIDGFYDDNRADYTRNEPNLVANALFQASVAAIRNRELANEYPGGVPLPNFDYSYIFYDWPFPEGTNVVDYCNSKTCKNDGVCYNDFTNHTFVCQCEDGYFGQTCDTIVEPVVQFERTWTTGGQIKVKLPSDRPLGAWQVELQFPAGCYLSTIDIWHACFDPYASNMNNGSFFIYQVGWHQGHEEIGLVFEAYQDYTQIDFWRSTAPCYQESEYALTLVARGSHMGENIDGMSLVWSTDPDRCPGELPWEPPASEPEFPDELIVGGEEAIDQAFLDLMINNYDGAGRTDDGLEVEWVAPGEEAAWMRIWLPVDTPVNELWQLRMVFPEQCDPLTVIGYQTCVNTEYTSLEVIEADDYSAGERPHIMLYQNGTDLNTDFIGLRIKFVDPEASEPCLDANSYMFEMLVWDDPDLAQDLIQTCETMFPDHETQLSMLGETSGVVVPVSASPSIEFMAGSLDWTQGANGHLFLPNPKSLAPMGLRVQVPAGCNIQRINFWHACVVLQMSDINNGLFELEQIGWQQEYGYIGFSVDFQPAQYQQSGVPEACKDPSSYLLQMSERQLDPLNPDFNGYYNVAGPEHCPATLGEALAYSPYEVQLQDGVNDGARSLNPSLQRTDMSAGSTGDSGLGRPQFPAQPNRNTAFVSGTEKQKMVEWAHEFTESRLEEQRKQEHERLMQQAAARNLPVQQLQNIPQFQYGGAQPASGGFTPSRPNGSFNPAGGSGLNTQSTPVDLETTVVDGRTAEIFWKHPSTKHDQYKVTLEKINENGVQLKSPVSVELISGRNNKFEFPDLIPGTRYEVQVATMNGKEASVPQRMLFATIPEDPMNLQATVISANKVKLTWEHAIGTRQTYRISSFPMIGTDNIYIDGELNEYIFENLNGQTDYLFIVNAESYNMISDGAFVPARTGSDWCKMKGTKCGQDGECVNYQNYGKCECKKGYKGNGFDCFDLDECTTGKSECDPNAICTNTIGSHICQCPQGFLDEDGTGRKCEDIDECTTIRPRCHHQGHCVNYPGSYACECKEGYSGDGTTFCNDIDECTSPEHNPCSEYATCANTVGSVTCECKKGFVGDGFTCTDINECELGDHTCAPLGGQCFNKPGGFGCRCAPGFVGNGWKCNDVDECSAAKSPCHERANCHNEPGTFRCKCKDGFRGDGINLCVNLDECATGMHKCDPFAICKDYVGTHRCKCKRGFDDKGMGFKGDCIDIDECKTGNNKCVGANVMCKNLPGGYKCPCKPGFAGDMRRGCKDENECEAGTHKCSPYAKCLNTIGSHKCSCRGGFTGDGYACYDIDECAKGQHNCNKPGSRCKNTPGRFECECAPGYTGSYASGCYDKNECTDGTAVCADDAVCKNTQGSFVCECAPGYKGNGKFCEDENECLTGTHMCDPNAKCTNTVGSYSCDCRYGFSGNGQTCVEIDECSDGSHKCGAESVCTNHDGGYDCSCPVGYDKEGRSCAIQDQCASNPCPAGSKCLNLFGTFACVCPDGMRGTPQTGCSDINECEEGRAGCSEHAYCTNTIGSFDCSCNPGYSGDGHECSDTNECERGHNCDKNAKCDNTEGSFTCECKPGFSGDGTMCVMNDPCLGGKHNCKDPMTCLPLGGDNFRCACPGGFFPDTANSENCIDIDECTMGLHDCGANEICENSHGGFTCKCAEGQFKQGGMCQERNECLAGLHNCDENASCLNTAKGFKCKCKDGFTGDGVTCEDIDECSIGVMRVMPSQSPKLTPACPGAECVNVVGSFKCKCKPGFKIVAGQCRDIDECSSGQHDCAAVATGGRCINLPGSFKCTCASGFIGSGKQCTSTKCQEPRNPPGAEIINCSNSKCEYQCKEGFRKVDGKEMQQCDWRGKWPMDSLLQCEDVDECALALDDCDREYGVCKNTKGSWSCSCPEGFDGDGKTCFEVNECHNGSHSCDENADCENTVGGHMCKCKTGFFGSGESCSDENECRDPSFCPGENMQCINTLGSAKCVCKAGYQQNGDTCYPAAVRGACAAANCGANAECIAFGKNAQCVCKNGYKGNGKQCTDINECLLDNNGCHGNATCSNTIGSYSCDCNEGFIGDGKNCNVPNSCETNNCHDNAKCIPTSATQFECECKEGFWGNGFTCNDRNECLKYENNRCNALATCENTIGSFKCNCKNGFEGDGVVCNDFDECEAGEHNCAENSAFCVNTLGSYKCKCKAGFKGNGEICIDINECYNMQHQCDPLATCTNFDGGYSCNCPEGYYGDGFTCVDINECATRKHNCDPNAKCTNTPSSFECTCNDGYFGDGTRCIEDQCESLKNSTCVENTTCVPKDNESIHCACAEGYKGDGYSECVDVDECKLDLTLCPLPNEQCVNTEGSYECKCEDGLVKNPNGKCVNDICRYEKCHQRAECEINWNLREPTASCKCSDGYQGDGETYCVDINECVFKLHDCSPRAKCRNEKGSYTCECVDGYTGDGKECLTPAEVKANEVIAHREAKQKEEEEASDSEGGDEIDPCESNPCFGDLRCSRLTDTEYECLCAPGQEMTNEGYCFAVVRAQSAQMNAPSGAQTGQRAGVFSQNRFGAANPSMGAGRGPLYQSSINKPVAQIAGGKKPSSWWQKKPFAGRGVQTNMQTTKRPMPTPAKPWARPTPKPTLPTTKRTWTTRPAPIPVKTTPKLPLVTTKKPWAQTTKRPWQATTKKPVWTRPAPTAAPVPTTTTTMLMATTEQSAVNFNNNLFNQMRQTTVAETTTTTTTPQPPPSDPCFDNSCHSAARCTASNGKAVCTCNDGYQGDGRNCNDINECVNRQHNCSANQLCTNTMGSFMCECKQGYVQNGSGCTDEDECATGNNNCGPDATCTNTDGGFECNCSDGFEQTSNGCGDINECNDNACHPDADCTNTIGSFECACKSGFKGNGLLCFDIDECSTGTHTCADGEGCINNKGSFECSGVACPPIGKFDLALLLDTRHSIGDEALQKTRDFARSLLEPYDMGPDSIKVTAAGYSGEKVTPASFLIDAAAKPKQALIDSVTKVNFSGNGLRIERSLAFLVNFSFLEAMGRRKANPGIAILTAGGKTDSPTALQAVVQRLRNDKTIRVITIGIGDAERSELASISGNPGYVFMVDDYSGLQGIVPDILNLICEIDEEFKNL